jgi:hypothetical protein
MMRRGLELTATVAVVVGLMLTVWGCEALSNYFEQAPQPTPTPSQILPSVLPTATATPEPTPLPDSEAIQRKPRGRARATETPSGAAPTITLDNDQAAQQRAQSLLDSANSKLGKVDQAKLNRADAATYAQAIGFADAARQALGEHDYVAATGLAEKASLLADKVATAASETPAAGF